MMHPRAHSPQSRRGFTLIELLVVIAIIGMLSSIVLASLNTARVKARDARRVSDMLEIQKAVELYNSDYGRYPISTCSNNQYPWASFDSPGYSPTTICATPNGIGSQTLTQALAPYIKSPSDPKPTTADSGYLYISSAGADYCVLIWNTPENMKSFGSSLVPARCGGVGSNGVCNNGNNSIYVGTGQYSAGC